MFSASRAGELMIGVLLLFGVFALSTVGGVVIARAGVDSEHVGSSTAGVLACVGAVVVATIVVTVTGVLHWA